VGWAYIAAEGFQTITVEQSTGGRYSMTYKEIQTEQGKTSVSCALASISAYAKCMCGLYDWHFYFTVWSNAMLNLIFFSAIIYMMPEVEEETQDGAEGDENG